MTDAKNPTVKAADKAIKDAAKGVEVATEALNKAKAGVTEAAQKLNAADTDQKKKTAQTAVDKAQAAFDEADAKYKEAQTEVAKANDMMKQAKEAAAESEKPEFVVAEGKAISGTKRGMIEAGKGINVDDLKGGKKVFDQLVEKGDIVKNK